VYGAAILLAPHIPVGEETELELLVVELAGDEDDDCGDVIEEGPEAIGVWEPELDVLVPDARLGT